MAKDNFGIKAITHIPGWAELLEQSDKVSNEPKSYMQVPLINRAVKLRADSLSSVPRHYYNGDTEIDWPFRVDPEKLIWETEAAMLLKGAAYWLKVKDNLSTRNVVWVNPFSVEMNYGVNAETGESRMSFWQPVTGMGPWGLDDMVYFREWDPLQDTHPGIAPASVALNDARLLNYITRFAYHFFEGGAMPVTVLGLEGVSPQDAKDTETKFKRLMTSIGNAFKLISVRADQVKISTLTPPLDELAMVELFDQAKKNVGATFGIPTTMLEDPSANRATADTHRLGFWADTIRPRGQLIQGTINDQLLADTGFRFEFGFNEMDVFQEDEAQRAGSLKAYVEAGYPLDLASEILGVDLTEDQQARLDAHLLAKKEMSTNLFGNLQPNTPETGENGAQGIKSDNMHTHLGLWEKKALKRLKLDKSPAIGFESDLIPSGLNGAILGALEVARNPDDVARVFNSIWGAYP